MSPRLFRVQSRLKAALVFYAFLPLFFFLFRVFRSVASDPCSLHLDSFVNDTDILSPTDFSKRGKYFIFLLFVVQLRSAKLSFNYVYIN